MIIKYDNNYVFFPDTTDCIDPKLDIEANKAGKLTFSLLESHELYQSISKLKCLFDVLDDDGSTIFRGRAIDSEMGFYLENEITVEGKLACLNDSVHRPDKYSGTVSGFLSKILENHNAQVSNGQKILLGNVSTNLDANDYIIREWKNHESSWDLVNKRLVGELGGYLIMRYTANGDYLDYKSSADLVTASTQHIEFGVNLMDLSRFIDATDIYTACIPLGAEIINIEYGQTSYTADNPPTWKEDTFYKFDSGAYVPLSGQDEFNTMVANSSALYTVTKSENTGKRVDVTTVDDANRTPPKVLGTDYVLATQSMIDAYGIIYAPVKDTTWDDVGAVSNLYNKAKNWLDNQGVMLSNKIDITFADLSKLGVNTDEISIHDRVIVKSTPHGVDSSGSPYLVEKISYKLDAPETSSITIGNEYLTLADSISKQNKDIDNAIKEIEKIEVDVSNKAETEYVNEVVRNSETSIMTYADSIEARVRTTEETLSGNGTTIGLVDSVSSLKQTSENFSVEFTRVNEQISEHGETIDKVNAVFDFSTDGLEIGREGSTSTMLLDNDSLEFKVNQATVAEFTNDHMWVRNVDTDNQIGFFDQWAIRKGVTVSGVGENLNDMWIG